MHRQGFVPLFFENIFQGRRSQNTGVIDEDVDAAPSGDGRLRDPLGVAAPAHVGEKGCHVGAEGSDLAAGFIERISIARRRQKQPSPLTREGPCHRQTDAAAAARDDRHLILKSNHSSTRGREF